MPEPESTLTDLPAKHFFRCNNCDSFNIQFLFPRWTVTVTTPIKVEENRNLPEIYCNDCNYSDLIERYIKPITLPSLAQPD